MIDLEMLPIRFNRDVYFNKDTNEVIKLEDVDDILQYETDRIFENYYKDQRAKRVLEEENKILHSYMQKYIKDRLDILYTKDYMKQRDALEYLDTLDLGTGSEPLYNLIKDYPKAYRDVIEFIYKQLDSYDSSISLGTIEDSILEEEALEDLSETMPPIKHRQLLLENYGLSIIRFYYLSVTNSRDYERYANDKFSKVLPDIEKSLIDSYDVYKQDYYDEYQRKVASDIINIQDYIIDNKYINWLDYDGKIYLVQTVYTFDSSVTIVSGDKRITFNREDIKEIERGGKTFTVVL